MTSPSEARKAYVALPPLVCSYCDKKALYQVDGRGYCKDHRKESLAAEAKRQMVRKQWAILQHLKRDHDPRISGYAAINTRDTLRSSTWRNNRVRSQPSLRDEIRSLAVADFKPKDPHAEDKSVTSLGIGLEFRQRFGQGPGFSRADTGKRKK